MWARSRVYAFALGYIKLTITLEVRRSDMNQPSRFDFVSAY